MKTQVSDSSIGVYHDEIRGAKESDQAAQALAVIRKLGRCTRRQVAVELKMETSTSARAVNGLLNDYKAQVFEELELFPCPITGRRVHWVYVKREPQMSLI